METLKMWCTLSKIVGAISGEGKRIKKDEEQLSSFCLTKGQSLLLQILGNILM